MKDVQVVVGRTDSGRLQVHSLLLIECRYRQHQPHLTKNTIAINTQIASDWQTNYKTVIEFMMGAAIIITINPQDL